MATEAQPTTLKDLSFSELIQLRDHFSCLAVSQPCYQTSEAQQEAFAKEVEYIDRGILARFQKIKADSSKKG